MIGYCLIRGEVKGAGLKLSERANATAQVNQTFRLKCPIASVIRTCPLIQHGGQFLADLPLRWGVLQFSWLAGAGIWCVDYPSCESRLWCHISVLVCLLRAFPHLSSQHKSKVALLCRRNVTIVGSIPSISPSLNLFVLAHAGAWLRNFPSACHKKSGRLKLSDSPQECWVCPAFHCQVQTCQ